MLKARQETGAVEAGREHEGRGRDDRPRAQWALGHGYQSSPPRRPPKPPPPELSLPSASEPPP
jgi:hypothetical protein